MCDHSRLRLGGFAASSASLFRAVTRSGVSNLFLEFAAVTSASPDLHHLVGLGDLGGSAEPCHQLWPVSRPVMVAQCGADKTDEEGNVAIHHELVAVVARGLPL